MRHVLVETNWVVDILMPSHRRPPAALSLLARARGGELMLHVPAFCFREAISTVQRKFQPRTDREAVLRFIRWGRQQGRWQPAEEDKLRRVADAFEQSVRHELKREQLTQRVDEIQRSHGVEVFALNEAMISRLIDLGTHGPKMEALDEAVLAAVLGRAAELRSRGEAEIVFCETDGDLLPWSKKGRDRGQPKEPLSTYYRDVGIEVIDGFVLD